VHDTVAAVMARLQRTLSEDELVKLTSAKAETLLTPAERQVLATEHIRFSVSVPVIVTIAREAGSDEVFWLRDGGFVRKEGTVKVHTRELALWEKTFPAGEIGLGVHNLSGQGTHYLALLRPRKQGDNLKVTGLYPAHLRTVPFVAGVQPYSDQQVRLESVPAQLQGQLLIQTAAARAQDAKLVNLFSRTEFPASNRPDQVVLTWSGDPRTTQTVQWRSAFRAGRGALRYHLKGATGEGAATPRVAQARTERIITPMLVNDPLVLRHTVTLTGLNPGSVYVYSVGDGTANGWTEPAEFTTAPAGVEPFSFIYMGDAQNGLDRWGLLLARAHAARPDAAFYLMAGDLVNRGAERWDWDSFFEHSKGVFNRRTLAPVIGNHECQGGVPRLYLDLFTLPRNGPAALESERAYSFEYSNAKFIILDSNLPPESQTSWLEKQLAGTTATWKFVSYHHPAYSSSPNRDNKKLRNVWTPIFDKYHVDLALQGHDHAYLRTYPMRGKQRVATARDGTIYVISVSGTKYYDQGPHDYTEAGFTKVSTYQVLDIQIQGNRLVYRAHDLDGKIRDEFVIQK